MLLQMNLMVGIFHYEGTLGTLKGFWGLYDKSTEIISGFTSSEIPSEKHLCEECQYVKTSKHAKIVNDLNIPSYAIFLKCDFDFVWLRNDI